MIKEEEEEKEVIIFPPASAKTQIIVVSSSSMSPPTLFSFPKKCLTLDQLREHVVDPVLASARGAVVLGKSMPCYGFQLTSGGPARTLHRSVLVRLRPSAVRIYVVRPRKGDFPMLAMLMDSGDKSRVWARLDADELAPAIWRNERLLFRVDGLDSPLMMAARVKPLLERIVGLFFRQETLLATLHTTLPRGTVDTEVLCAKQRLTHTEIKSAAGSSVVTFTMGAPTGRPQFGIHHLEVADGSRAPAVYTALSRYVDRDDAWSVDEDGVNIEFLPLPTADIARCIGARIAELPLAAVSQ